MGSSFFGFNIATQGLNVARGALSITNHNIANVNTKGYSRQQALQRASRPLRSNTGTGMIGTGAEITNIVRIREKYLDDKFLRVNGTAGHYNAKETSMKELETIFNEPSDEGFNNAIDSLFTSLEDLSIKPEDASYKTAAVGKIETFTKYFNTAAGKLQDLQATINSTIETKVNQVNNTGKQIQLLNRQIASLEFSGDIANDLRDQRDLLVDDLSRIVNTETKETTLGNGLKEFKVMINGETFIDNESFRQLQLVARENKSNPEDVKGLYDIKWENGQIFNTNKPGFEGELKGYIDIRDGNNNMNLTGIVKEVLQETTSPPKYKITIGDPSRLDLSESGQITIKNKVYTYDSYEMKDGGIVFKGVSLDSITDVTVGDKLESGESNEYKGVPYYLNKLNKFVRTFANEFNNIYKQGQTDSGETNKELFTFKGDTETAFNFEVSEDILNNIDNLATRYNKNSGESDSSLINDLKSIKQQSRAFDNGKPSTYIELVISQAGIDTAKAQNFNINKENEANIVQNQRLSNSGVDLNEEGQNMIKFQQAYNASAKMLRVMNEIYDVTINQMGI